MKFVTPSFLHLVDSRERSLVASALLKYLLTVVLAWGLTGCAQVKLNSTSENMPQSQPQRLLVVFTAPHAWGKGIKDFTDSFTNGLQACGSQAHVLLIEAKFEDLSLKDEAAEKRQQILNEEANFSPDGILFVWNNGYISSSSYGVTTLQFDFSYGHVSADKSSRPSWHGKAAVPAGLGSDFAAAILKDMKKNGILHTCPATDE